MIADFFISLGGNILAWFATLFPTFPMPSWVTNASTVATGLLDAASNLGVWIPWAAITLVLTGRLAVYGVMFGVRLAIKVWGQVPVIGGSG